MDQREYLGDGATTEDSDRFNEAVEEAMEEGYGSREEAVEYVWNNGDFLIRL